MHLIDRAEVDGEALHAELEKLHPACYGWALACCDRDGDEACDTLQTAYLRILSGQARFAGRSALRTWVFGVIRMVARERRLQAVRRQRREEVAPAPSHFDDRDAADSMEELLAALQQISTRQREVLELVFYHELTIEEAGKVMNVSVGTARTHYERGKQRLRAVLASKQGVR